MPRTILLSTLIAATLFGAGPTPATVISDRTARTRPPARHDQLGFDRAPLNTAWPDGTTWGNWYSLHNGFGRTTVVNEPTGRALLLSTRSPNNSSETYSSLVHSTRTFADIDFTVRLRTLRQLRQAPNPWEVAWVLWRYTDNEHFYSFIVKPNGWELAKEDTAYPGKQRFLAYSYACSYPTGRTYAIRIRHLGNHITVWVDGKQIVAFTDHERPYRSGSIALYTEDAATLYRPVELRPVLSARPGKWRREY